jgi:hypothetical protein
MNYDFGPHLKTSIFSFAARSFACLKRLLIAVMVIASINDLRSIAARFAFAACLDWEVFIAVFAIASLEWLLHVAIVPFAQWTQRSFITILAVARFDENRFKAVVLFVVASVDWLFFFFVTVFAVTCFIDN